MVPDAREVRLTPEERAELGARVRAPTSEQPDVFRARIVLLAAEGRSTRSIARELSTLPRTVSTRRNRFADEGLPGWSSGRVRVGAPRPSTMARPIGASSGCWSSRRREGSVVLDNLSTHNPKRDGWLARHKNVHFHFTPTHAHWL